MFSSKQDKVTCVFLVVRQYSDLAEAERVLVLERFRQSALSWSQSSAGQSGDDKEKVEDTEKKSHVIVVTDVCLPLIASGESPLSARVLINYELPGKKVMVALLTFLAGLIALFLLALIPW